MTILPSHNDQVFLWVNATDRSKAVVLMLSFVVFTTGRFTLSCLALFLVIFFSVLLAASFVYVLHVHLFVYFARVNFCPFSLPLGVRGWLRLVAVALPALFYHTFKHRYISTLTLEPGHEKMCLMSYANNKGADQPAHPRSLVSAFAVRCLDSIISLDSIAEISRL